VLLVAGVFSSFIEFFASWLLLLSATRKNQAFAIAWFYAAVFFLSFLFVLC